MKQKHIFCFFIFLFEISFTFWPIILWENKLKICKKAFQFIKDVFLYSGLATQFFIAHQSLFKLLSCYTVYIFIRFYTFWFNINFNMFCFFIFSISLSCSFIQFKHFLIALFLIFLNCCAEKYDSFKRNALIFKFFKVVIEVKKNVIYIKFWCFYFRSCS